MADQTPAGFVPDGFVPDTPQTPPTYWQQHPNTAQMVRGALNTLPAVGGMLGGAVATPETFGGGTVLGAALGAGAGRGARDLIAEHLGIDTPTTPLSKGARIALDTAITAAMPAAVNTARRVLLQPKATLADVIETFAHPQQTLDNIVQVLRATPAVPSSMTPAIADQVVPLAGDVGGLATQGGASPTLASAMTRSRIPYSPVLEQPSALSRVAPLAEGGASPVILHGAEQFREPYYTPPPPTPNATPLKLPNGTWTYIEKGTREILPEGSTANVVSKSGKTWTTTVPAPIDVAADLRAAKMLVTSGVSPEEAATKIAAGSAQRFGQIIKGLSAAPSSTGWAQNLANNPDAWKK